MCSTFFFNDTATTEIYTLSLHDALPICHDLLDLRAQAPLDRGLLLVARQVRCGRVGLRAVGEKPAALVDDRHPFGLQADRKSTRLNSSHANISYAVFCLKKKDRARERGV